MAQRLKEAAIAGLVIGVKWGVAIVAIGALLLLWIGDYTTTRNNAANAVNFIQQYGKPLVDLQQQASHQPAPVAATTPDASKKPDVAKTPGK